MGLNRQRIFDEIARERERQTELHPGTDDAPDGTGGSGRRTWETIARNACDRAAREGRCSFAHVLDEEASEVLAEEDPVKLRSELVQLAAVCVKWVEKLDRERK